MNQEYFAGFNLEEVYEQNEARLKQEREEQEKIRRKSELEERLRKKHGVESPVSEIPRGNILTPSGVGYSGLDFENPKHDEWMYFDASLERLKGEGYDRHPRPWEAFSLIIDHLEDKLAEGSVEDLVAKNMLSGKGEWFGMAVERRGDRLYLYADPENLKWDKDKKLYVIEGDKLVCDMNFGSPYLNVAGIPSQQWVDLKEFDDDFTQTIYTRKFKDLPEEMREGGGRAQIYLPPEKVMWPVGRGDGFDIDSDGCGGRASRGVRARKTRH